MFTFGSCIGEASSQFVLTNLAVRAFDGARVLNKLGHSFLPSLLAPNSSGLLGSFGLERHRQDRRCGQPLLYGRRGYPSRTFERRVVCSGRPAISTVVDATQGWHCTVGRVLIRAARPYGDGTRSQEAEDRGPEGLPEPRLIRFGRSSMLTRGPEHGLLLVPTRICKRVSWHRVKF